MPSAQILLWHHTLRTGGITLSHSWHHALSTAVQAAQEGRYEATCCPICFTDFPAKTAPAAPPATEATEAGAAGERDELLERSAATEAPVATSGEGGGKTVEPFMLPCGHTFCEKCISRWLADHHECPGAFRC